MENYMNWNLYGRINAIAILCLLITVTLLPLDAYAVEKTDSELFEIAFNAYQQADYLTAVIYLTAYIENEPAKMRNDSVHAAEVRDALKYARTKVSQYQEVAQLRADLRSCQNRCSEANTGSSVQGITQSPPELSSPFTPPPRSYPIVCRGGAPLLFTYAATSDLSSDPQVWLVFNKASTNVGTSWENIGHLSPGQCAWLDRPVGTNEPNRIVLEGPELRPEQFAISWQDNQITDIVSKGLINQYGDSQKNSPFADAQAQENAPEFQQFQPYDPLATGYAVQDVALVLKGLHSAQWLQSFDVYNDSDGNFIATAIGTTDTLGNYVPLYKIVEVKANDTLNLRSMAGMNYPVISKIPYNGQNVEVTGKGVAVENSLWVPVRYQQVTGWVNSNFLAEQGNLPADQFEYVRQLSVKNPFLNGLDVRLVQRRLIELGYTEVGPIDGIYGPQTESAVLHWQQNNGIASDGIIRAQAWQLLFIP